MEILGYLSPEDRLFLEEWCKEQHLANVTRSRYAPRRLEKWFGLASNLGYLHTGQAKVFVATIRDVLPSYLIQMGDQLSPGWNSILVCGGDTTITLHKDHPHFDKQAAMVNLGVALFEQQLEKKASLTSFKLTPGQVVGLDISLPHCATQESTVRYNITFRRIRDQFLGDVGEFTL